MALLLACTGVGVATPATAGLTLNYNGQSEEDAAAKGVWVGVEWDGYTTQGGGSKTAAAKKYTGYKFSQEEEENVVEFVVTSGTDAFSVTPILVETDTTFKVAAGQKVTLNMDSVVGGQQTEYQVSGPGKLTKAGEGTLTLANINPAGQADNVVETTQSYTGDVEVKEGVLCIDGGGNAQGCSVGAREDFTLDVQYGAELLLVNQGRVNIPNASHKENPEDRVEISSKGNEGVVPTTITNLHADLHSIRNIKEGEKAVVKGGKMDMLQSAGNTCEVKNLDADVMEISYYGMIDVTDSNIKTEGLNWFGSGQDDSLMSLHASQLTITSNVPLGNWVRHIHVDKDSSLVSSNTSAGIALVVGAVTLDISQREFTSVDSASNTVYLSTNRLSGMTLMDIWGGSVIVSMDDFSSIPGITTTDALNVQLTLQNVYFSEDYETGEAIDYEYASEEGLTGLDCLGSAPVWLTAEKGGAWDEAMKQMTSYQVAASAQGGITVTFSLPAPKVPEPATGTLSLLALAGLCARRRRK